VHSTMPKIGTHFSGCDSAMFHTEIKSYAQFNFILLYCGRLSKGHLVKAK